jgi:DNA primase
MFSFIMEVEGLEFKEALELLARKAGIDIEQYRSTRQSGGPDKERLHAALDAATRFYQVQFSQNKTALEYVFKKRQFTKETALEWHLGYSPNNGTALIDALRAKNFTEAELQQAGLTARSYRGGIQDMFRGRLMIPLQDPQGRVIGFTARQLQDEPNSPKYINTPQTVLYDKSRHVYGLHLAKESIRKHKFVVLAEGNLDVISSHQAGVRQVVATAGTALTEPHLKALSRFTGDLRLAFDADKAGAAATERAIPIASRVKVTLSIIDIPSGKDPDELIKQDPKLWEQAIEHHKYALDWLMDRYKKLLDLDSAVGKREFSDILLPTVRALSDPVERDHYINAIAQTLGVSLEALNQKLQKTDGPQPQARRRVKTSVAPLNKTAVENQKLQDNFLGLILMRPTLREFLGLITEDMLYTDSGKRLFKFLNEHPDFDGKDAQKFQKTLNAGQPTVDKPGETVQTLADYVKIESLLYEELYQGLELNELHYEAARLQARLIANYVKSQKEQLANQMETADEADTQRLLEQAKTYDQLLNLVKGASRGESERSERQER